MYMFCNWWYRRIWILLGMDNRIFAEWLSLVSIILKGVNSWHFNDMTIFFNLFSDWCCIMPTTCGFPNCKFRSRYRGADDNRHFYRVPKKPAVLREKWLVAIGKTEETIVNQVGPEHPIRPPSTLFCLFSTVGALAPHFTILNYPVNLLIRTLSFNFDSVLLLQSCHKGIINVNI